MLPIAKLAAPLIAPMTNKIIEALGGLMKSPINSMLKTDTQTQHVAPPTRSKICF